MKFRTPSFKGTLFESTYSLRIYLKHDAGGDNGQMLEIPITVLSGDPRQTQSYLPLAPFHQLIDVRQSMVDQ
jgi:hypothetical protein